MVLRLEAILSLNNQNADEQIKIYSIYALGFILLLQISSRSQVQLKVYNHFLNQEFFYKTFKKKCFFVFFCRHPNMLLKREAGLQKGVQSAPASLLYEHLPPKSLLQFA